MEPRPKGVKSLLFVCIFPVYMAERVPLLLMAAPRFDLYVNEMAAEIYSTHITYRRSR